MIVIHKTKNIIFHDWDYKDAPSFNNLYKAVQNSGMKNPIFMETETKSDELCVIVAETSFNKNELAEIYKSAVNDSLGESGEWKVL